MKTMPWVLVALLVVGIALPAHGQSLDFELTFQGLIRDVATIKNALGIGYGSSSGVIDALEKRVHDLEFAKTLARIGGNSEVVADGKLDEMLRRTVDTRISTLERKNDDLLGRIKDLEFGNELLRDRVKALEDSSTPRAKGKSPTSAR